MNYHSQPEYPFYPGSYGSDTSDAAAQAIAPATARIQRKVLGIVVAAKDEGLTAHEVAARLGCENTTTQPRLTELMLLGLVKDSGRRRQNRSGRSSRVWIATGYAMHRAPRSAVPA